MRWILVQGADCLADLFIGQCKNPTNASAQSFREM
jgi:hypothetical protein